MGEGTSNSSFNFSVAVQVVAWLVGVLLAYGAINTRVAVTEAHVTLIQQDLHEVKQDVKTLLQRK